MPAKIARSAPRPPTRATHDDGSRPRRPRVLPRGPNSANIHVRGVIWRMPVETKFIRSTGCDGSLIGG
jgi:hypothetical protein